MEAESYATSHCQITIQHLLKEQCLATRAMLSVCSCFSYVLSYSMSDYRVNVLYKALSLLWECISEQMLVVPSSIEFTWEL